jgi:hypothetical protein
LLLHILILRNIPFTFPTLSRCQKLHIVYGCKCRHSFLNNTCQKPTFFCHFLLRTLIFSPRILSDTQKAPAIFPKTIPEKPAGLPPQELPATVSLRGRFFAVFYYLSACFTNRCWSFTCNFPAIRAILPLTDLLSCIYARFFVIFYCAEKKNVYRNVS